jgi:hypothetical protein
MPFIIDDKQINKISGPVSMHVLTPTKTDLPLFILFGDIHESDENMCKEDESDGVYKIYDVNFLKLFDTLTTPDEPIDFYVEGGDFHSKIHDKPPSNENNYPMEKLWDLYVECYKKNLITYERKVDCSKVRWQSGDPRSFDSGENQNRLYKCNMHYFIDKMNTGMKYLDSYPLFSNSIVKQLKEFNDVPGGIDALLNEKLENFENIFSEKNLINKQLKKFERGSIEGDIKQYSQNLISELISEQKDFEIIKETDNVFKQIILYFISDEFQTQDPKFKPFVLTRQQYEFLTEDNNYKFNLYRTFLMDKYVSLLDIYTISRSLKYHYNNEYHIKPIINIIYAGDKHIYNMVNILTNILNLYKSVFNHNRVMKTMSKFDRCIDFTSYDTDSRINFYLNISDIVNKLKHNRRSGIFEDFSNSITEKRRKRIAAYKWQYDERPDLYEPPVNEEAPGTPIEQFRFRTSKNVKSKKPSKKGSKKGSKKASKDTGRDACALM